MKVTTVTTPPIVSVHDTERRSPTAELDRLSSALRAYPEAAEAPTAATALLEHRIARALGKPAALLMPTGKMAQQIAFRIHADRRPGRREVLAHPANHPSLWEDENYSLLHEVSMRLIADRFDLLRTDDLRASLSDDTATVLWELPQRELGGELPSWTDLETQLELARAHGAATHLDGARIWQVEPFYDTPLDVICSGFDSVYVSLYKDLEAPRGAVLVGERDFVDTARAWRHRMGGTVDELWPLALLALTGMDRVASRMPTYVAHARDAAHEITTRTSATVRPNPPHAAMFHVHLPIGVDSARRAHEQLVHEGRPRLCLRFRSVPDPTRSSFEVSFGEAAQEISVHTIADAVTRLIDLARRPTSCSARHEERLS